MVALLTDNNAIDGKIDGAESTVIDKLFGDVTQVMEVIMINWIILGKEERQQK